MLAGSCPSRKEGRKREEREGGEKERGREKDLSRIMLVVACSIVF